VVGLGGAMLGLGDGVTRPGDGCGAGLGDGEPEAATVGVAAAVMPLPIPLLGDEHAASPAAIPIRPIRNADFLMAPL
jgi:hypothetical protein